MRSSMRKYAKPIALALAIALVIALDAAFGFSARLTGSEAWCAMQVLLAQNYAAAVVLYLALTIAGCVLLALPGVVFAIAGSALFGPVMGTLWCVLGASAGAVLAFLAGRYFLRDIVRERAVRNDLLRRWLFSGSRRNEVVTLAVTRLVPIFPFNVQNFAYGATDMSLGTYSACTFLFMIPGTALYTFGTAGLLDAQGRAVYLGAAAVLAVCLVAAAALLRRRFLDE